MGEPRVKVLLTNATDLELAQLGHISAEQVRRYEADALADSGSVCTILPPEVVARLGIRIRGQRTAEYADGRQESVGLTAPLLIDIAGRETADEAMVLGEEVLIGQTVLEKLDMLVDCANRRVIRNPAHPDQAVNKVKTLGVSRI
ncbi:MAG: clan AA aspartic protease [Acidobacteria bacterium]|nr:clan AA aspartic protease [Acidobacteriota bacterium]MBI3425059.1 clan AA aspartic protease [Acidobacteriota bacterium]